MDILTEIAMGKIPAIEFIDKLTGETIVATYETIEEAEQLYLKINSMHKALDHAKGKLTDFIGKQVEDRYDFGDGYKGMWVPRNIKKYRIETVRKYLDEDQLALVIDINSRNLKFLLEQLVEDGKGLPGAWTDIEANADIRTGKPSFQIRKGL